MAKGPGAGERLEQERVRVLPIRVGPPAPCTLLSGGGKGAALASPCVWVVPHHLPVSGRASSP